ncbi:MAG: type I restriction enzyme HsdR N-terminal domain-containing protein [Pseudorhodoplanes sp.]|nr:type I restriction enzyme HsdR N-terminal domain-containing protein [Pseudorhodoplanes sp.]
MAVSQKIATRISTELKRYQSILAKALQRDISESDTVVIIADMLSDVLGYDKYQHITTEFAIRGTYVDLAVRTENQIRFLIEAKAIGIDLNDNHIKQAVDYAANEGIDWVVLTNGVHWRIYKVQFSKPIDKTLLCDIDILNVSPRNEDVIECFGCLSREGFSKSAMGDLLQQKQVTSKFAIAAILLSDSVIEHLRRDIRRLSGVRVDEDYLKSVLQNEIIKRELIEGDEATAAASTVKKMLRALARERKRTDEESVATQSSGDTVLSEPSSPETGAPQGP